ncbi:MAG: ABC transporter permease [Clostridiaceae bacterium]
MKKKYKETSGIFATIMPSFAWMAVFLAIPMIYIVLISFFTRGTYGQIIHKFTINNFTALFDPLYLGVFWDSIIMSFFTTLFCLVLGYPFAYSIARVDKKYRGILMILIIIPFWTNSLIRTYAWILLLGVGGIFNNILMSLKIISQPIQMLYNYGAIFIGMVYTLFPFMVLPLCTAIDKLDKSYLEAASDLGAKPWDRFWNITVPLTMPGITAGSILVFIPSLGYFFISDLMGGSKKMLIGNLIQNQFLTARNWPLGAALSVILIILTFILIGGLNKLTGKKGSMEVF